eukprot:SAG31_NODE_3338_length_4388_cov_1.970856_4_plen_249_part_00
MAQWSQLHPSQKLFRSQLPNSRECRHCIFFQHNAVSLDLALCECSAATFWLSLTHLDKVVRGPLFVDGFRLCSAYVYVGNASMTTVNRYFETTNINDDRAPLLPRIRCLRPPIEITRADMSLNAASMHGKTAMEAASVVAETVTIDREPLTATGQAPLFVQRIRYPPLPSARLTSVAAHYECACQDLSIAELLQDCVPYEWVVIRGSGAAAGVTAALATITNARPLLASYGPKCTDKWLLDREGLGVI